MTATPASFDYAFEDADDANATWTFDPMHFPHPVPRLAQDVVRGVQFGMGAGVIFVNGYAFNRFGQMPLDAEVFRKGAVRIWEEDYVPAISAFCREVRLADYASMPANDVVAALPGMFTRAGGALKYTFTVIPGYMPQTIALLDYSEETLGADGPVLVGALLQGMANDTAGAAAGLAELTEFALSLPAVSQALRADGAAADLARVEGGALFHERLEAYAAEYGWRAQEWGTIHAPTLAEDHTQALALVAGYLRDEETSPRAALRRAAEKHQEAELIVRERLSGEAAERFWQLLEAASPHVSMSENRAFWQLTIVGSLRVPIMALGGRLAESGVVDEPGDVFHLSLDEVRESLATPGSRRTALVAERKAQMSEAQDLRPPPFLGRPPAPGDMPAPATAMFTRFFGGEIVQPEDPNVIKGNAGNNGVVRGTARVVRDLADAGRLEPGEILVCTTTAPPWTPLFAIASAVVTDTGGVISHSAICAREFGIPCVVGTRVGTSRIPDGATITVDGGAGTVTIEE